MDKNEEYLMDATNMNELSDCCGALIKGEVWCSDCMEACK